jgi:hypothetical protein
MSDYGPMLRLYQALDEEVARRRPPTLDEIDAEIEELLDDAWRFGVSPEEFVEDCRSHSPAFWQDWFAMDEAADRTGASPDEIARAVFYRELARHEPEQDAPDDPWRAA